MNKEITLSTIMDSNEEVIEISAVGDAEQTFNLTNSDTVDVPDVQSPPTPINLTPRKDTQRSIEPHTPVRVKIDPTTLQSNTKPVINKRRSEDIAYSDLEKGIQRKTEEYKIAMEALVAKDTQNRLMIAEGIEDANDIKEVIYMDPHQKALDEDALSNDDFDNNLEKELNDVERTVQVAEQVQRERKPIVMDNNDLFKDIKSAMVSDIVNDIDKKIEGSLDDQNDIEDLDKEMDEVSVESVPSIKEDPITNPAPIEESVKKEDTILSEFFNSGVVVKSKDNIVDLPDVKNINQDDLSIDPEDFTDLDDDTEEDKANVERVRELYKKGRQNLKNEVLNKIVGAASKFDVSSFNISNKPASLHEALSKSKKHNEIKPLATWVLNYIKRPYTTSALTGPEIVMLTALDEEDSIFSSNVQQAKILYNHDENPYKPSTFEAWAKTIPYNDLDNIFFAIYLATFAKANYLPYTCQNRDCMNAELQYHDVLWEMVNFKNDKVKEDIIALRETPITADVSSEYESVIIPINDVIAIGFKLPSIYNMLIELRSVGQKFIEKYAAIITVITYIDKIYVIDDGSFKPVEYKMYPGDVAKTFKSKIATYSRILDTLDINEYNVLITYINTASTKYDDFVTYLVPESKCSKCHSVITKIETSAKELVFSHQRLVDTVTTSIE